jgi:hypothetical protein
MSPQIQALVQNAKNNQIFIKLSLLTCFHL